MAFCQLNDATRADSYNLPRCDDLLDKLAGKPLYSTFDAFSGYYSVAMEDSSVLLTAFQTPFGTFVWNVMPFGLKNAPAVYSRLTDMVYGDLDRTAVFIDDLCTGHLGESSILADIEAVLERCRKAKLKLKAKKCYFGFVSVEFLGHQLSVRGMSMVQSKVDKIARMPAPCDKTQLASVLGMYSYYRRFIPQMSTVAAPLTTLLSPKQEFEWTPACQDALDELKRRFLKQPSLAPPDDSKPYLLDTDASAYGVGAVLSQLSGGQERPIYFHSKKLNSSERNYSCTEREALAVVSALKKFRVYVLGRSVTVRTDHAPLCALFRKREVTGRLARWQAIASEYSLRFVTRPGVRHQNADAVSRLIPIENTKLSANAAPEDDDEIRAFVSRDVLRQYEMVAEYEKPLRKVETGTSRFRWGIDRLLYVGDDGAERVCLLPNEVPATIRQEHVDSGHFNAEMTIRTLSQRFWWPGMAADVRRAIKECPNCQLHGQKPPTRVLRSVSSLQPWDLIQLDSVSGLPQTYRKAVAFLTAVDCFTGFCVAQPVRNLTADAAATFFRDRVVFLGGMPSHILTDNGREFMGQFHDAVLECGAVHHYSTPYLPRSHGKIERTQRLLLDRLRRMDAASDWDLRLPLAVYMTNSRRGRGRLSPIELLMGYFPRSRRELKLTPPGEVIPSGDVSSTSQEERLRHLGVARLMHDASGDPVRRGRRRHAPSPDLHPGDEVCVFRHGGRPSKLETSWQRGTLQWVGELGACVVLIDGVERRVPRERVRLFHLPEPS